MGTLATPAEVLTKAATCVAIGTDTSVYVGPCRLVGAWIHHTATGLLVVNDSTSNASGFKFSIRNPSSNMASLPLAAPAGVIFNVGIHANCTVTAAAFIAYVPL